MMVNMGLALSVRLMQLSVTMYFLRVRTNVYKVGCSVQACEGELVKLKFLRPLPTLVTDPNFIHLATGLSVILRACRLHFQACL